MTRRVPDPGTEHPKADVIAHFGMPGHRGPRGPDEVLPDDSLPSIPSLQLYHDPTPKAAGDRRLTHQCRVS